jgi:kynurenine formamidase
VKLVDLSHPLENGQPAFPGDPAILLVPQAAAGYRTTEIHLSTHQGTHLDAPYHFFDDGTTVDRIPLERFYGTAALIDFGTLEAGARITVEMLAPHAGLFREGARVIYRTGWDHLFGRAEFFRSYPSLTLEAARWIAAQKIWLLGMDTPGPSEDWLEVHRALLHEQIVIVESLANLDKLPPQFTFIGFPLKIAGRDGSPVRAVAEW